MTEMTLITDRPVPQPEAWVVMCPNCGEPIGCEMDEDIDGSFFVSDRDGDQFVRCEPCGVFFAPARVIILSEAER